MKKILMFQDYFYIGGIEKVILDIKKTLEEEYQIDVLTMVNKSKENIKVLLHKDYKNFLLRNMLGIPKFKKHLKNNEYDIIHIHCYNAFGLIYAHIAYKYCKNIIIHAHNSGIDNDTFYAKHIVNSIIKTFFKSNKYQYIAVSKECNKFCFYNHNCIILPNAVDYKKYLFNKIDRTEYKKRFKLKEDDIVIGNIARFEKQKNHEFIIDIFSKINKVNNKYKLVLVGEGSEKKHIIDKVHRLKLDSNVMFLNNRNDIPRLINMFDIYLFPSVFEGFGITVVENQINGKYVFTSNNVSKQTKISNRIWYLSLKKGANYWTKKIMALKPIELKLDNKLDIINYIEKIKKIYQ